MNTFARIALLWVVVGGSFLNMPVPIRRALLPEWRTAQLECIKKLDYKGGLQTAIAQTEVKGRGPGSVEYEEAGCFINCLMDELKLIDDDNLVNVDAKFVEYKVKTWVEPVTVAKVKEAVNECNTAVKRGYWETPSKDIEEKDTEEKDAEEGIDDDAEKEKEKQNPDEGECAGASIFFDCIRHNLKQAKIEWPANWHKRWTVFHETHSG